MRRHPCRRLSCALVLGGVLVGSAEAQIYGIEPDRQGWYLTPSIAFGGVYEDNVFFTPGTAQSSPLARMTPGLQAQFRRGSRTFDAGYRFDAERYPERFDVLSSPFARQEAFGDYESAIDRRSVLRFTGRFLSTTRPEEVLQDTGLIPVRGRSRSIIASGRYLRRLSRRLSAEVGYLLSVRDFERPGREVPRTGAVGHALVSSLSFQVAPRWTSALRYSAQWLVPDEVPGIETPELSFSSHVVTLQVGRRLNRRIDVDVSLGPRVSEGLRATPGDVGVVQELVAEADAGLRIRAHRSRFELRYTKTQQQAIGLGGFTNTDRLTFNAEHDPTARVRLRASPAVFRNERGGVDTSSFLLDVGLIYQFRRTALIEGLYRYQYQDGFAVGTPGTGVDEAATRNTLMISFKLFKVYDAN